MPAISKIRFTNVIYENGGKRYNDEIFQFDGHNGAVILENGGGKTVFIQTAIQAIVPHMDLADRKIKDTLSLENGAAHIAIEWIINDSPRRYAVTAVTLFIENNTINSYKYAYEYGGEDGNDLESMPFVRENSDHTLRPASKGEILDYYQRMAKSYMSAKMFDTITEYHIYIEENFKIIESEWRNIGVVNSAEGDVDRYFDRCKTTSQLLNNLLIPVVEKAIEGAYKNDFAKTFEKQREHFKKNKILLDQIRESQETRDQLQRYIDVYEKLNQKEAGYNAVKIETKSLFHFIKTKQNNGHQQLALFEERLKALEDRSKVLEKKKLSLRIFERKLILDQAQKELSLLGADFATLKNHYDEKAARKQNIELTELKNDMKVVMEQLDLMKEQLDRIDQDEELSELLLRFEENSGQLKGYFVDQLKIHEREDSFTESQLERYREEKEGFNQQLLKVGEILQEELSKKVKYETINNRLTKEMEVLTKALLENYESDGVEEYAIKWQQRLDQLKHHLISLESDLKAESEEKEKALDTLNSKRRQKEVALTELNQCDGHLEYYEAEQEKVYQMLEPYIPNLYLKHSIYERQTSIENVLMEKEVYQTKRKEAALKEERMISRLLDAYEEAELFTADPLLIRIAHELKGTTSYSELGSHYFQEMQNTIGPDEFEAFKGYSLWAITLLTTERDLEIVNKKLERYKNELTHPVIVLTTDQLRDLLQGDKTFLKELSENYFLPHLWSSNINKHFFEAWKSQLVEEVKDKKASRVEEDNKASALISIRKQVHTFFKEFSYEQFEALKVDQAGYLKEVESCQNQVQALEDRIAEIDKNSQIVHQRIHAIKDESSKLEMKLYEAQNYLSKAKEHRENQLKYDKILSSCEEKAEESKVLIRQIKSQEDLLQDLKDRLYQIKREIDMIKDHSIYKEVEAAKPLFTKLSLKALSDRRKLLTDQVSGKNSDRKTIMDRIQEKEEDLNKKKETLRHKEQEAEYPIEIISNYYNKELSELIEGIKKLSKAKREFEEKVGKKKGDIEVQKQRKDDLEKECQEKFGEIVYFEEELLSLQNHLEEERKAIKKEKDGVWLERQRLSDTMALLEQYLHQLNSLNYNHDFLSIQVEDADLYQEKWLNDTKELGDTTLALIQQINILFVTYDVQKKEVESEKNRIKRYCLTTIKDTKLKEMVISGIDRKQNYNELLDFGNKMLERINQIIKLAEHDRMTSDKELQIFLEHVHTYLTTVAGELDSIQRKTSINIDGSLKQIFSFTIPKWDEQTGKEELRKHIDWIVDQLENQKDGVAIDELTSQKNLENWLSVKRLFQCILGDQSIVIKCRKVTNDKKISSLPSSWEHSNQWSGGEKWSKNMTLFLGILIYIAEKKQYLTNNEKKQRTVILDNPFGKASSKHVLDPVFFIAERLGFQIIALTAHAEGDFIRNYFPVVYSCKLKGSAESGKQIMTKEKEIHYAYLREHDPQSLRRFQEVEQITMDQLFI